MKRRLKQIINNPQSEDNSRGDKVNQVKKLVQTKRTKGLKTKGSYYSRRKDSNRQKAVPEVKKGKGIADRKRVLGEGNTQGQRSPLAVLTPGDL